MDLATLQQQIEHTYGDRDRDRGIPSTVAWLAEEVGELARAVRKGTRAEQIHEVGDVLAWLISLANQLEIPMTDAAARYAEGCPRCFESPCNCDAATPDFTQPSGVIEEVLSRLGTRSNACGPDEFPLEASLGDSPGLYAWWVDAAGLEQLQVAFDDPIKELVYAGQAGAASNATLRSRVRGNHIRGNIYGSTMRRTFASILFESLDLELADRRKLTRDSESRLSQWIVEHLAVVAVAIPERSEILELEPVVLRELDPAFNLDHVTATPNRERLRALRRRLEAVA